MPRPMWIGSASSKTPTSEHHDVTIEDPNGPEQRIYIYCDSTRVAHVLWQTKLFPGPNGPWIDMLGNPPYLAFDLGIMGQPQAPQLANLVVGAGGQHNVFVANWVHNMQFDMSAQFPQVTFSYQPGLNKNPRPPRIHFRSLSFIQQIQTATLALARLD
jgi:hypothetical protein